jgi:hypothetical protein
MTALGSDAYLPAACKPNHRVWINEAVEIEMWTITTDEAAVMYARFCRSRYGAKAKKIVEEKTEVLRKAGDTEGERVWSKVRQQIEIQNSN